MFEADVFLKKFILERNLVGGRDTERESLSRLPAELKAQGGAWRVVEAWFHDPETDLSQNQESGSTG